MPLKGIKAVPPSGNDVELHSATQLKIRSFFEIQLYEERASGSAVDTVRIPLTGLRMMDGESGPNIWKWAAALGGSGEDIPQSRRTGGDPSTAAWAIRKPPFLRTPARLVVLLVARVEAE